MAAPACMRALAARLPLAFDGTAHDEAAVVCPLDQSDEEPVASTFTTTGSAPPRCMSSAARSSPGRSSVLTTGICSAPEAVCARSGLDAVLYDNAAAFYRL
ncbi:hypothetical protein [Streptomyces sp. NPDC058045]|uniref:hypothetical protein n=1 Tax=Streptomyces sp. NPDC058045 TaxID=3346311 RepID=UPI0036E2F219